MCHVLLKTLNMSPAKFDKNVGKGITLTEP